MASSGVGGISVVVTTIPTPGSHSCTNSLAGANTTTTTSGSRRVSHIKLVGVGGVEGQSYCCGHWFPSAKSYHRHLAEKALSDTVHEMKLVELGMIRCAHCSMWVHVDGMNTHLRKNHGIIKVNKAGKLLPSQTATEFTRLSGEGASAGTNFVIKVSGHNANKSFTSNVTTNSSTTPVSKTSTVKLVATPSSTLYHKVKNFQQVKTSGTGKVIVHKSMPNTLPYVNVGPRIVMKTIGPRKILTLDNSCTVLPQSPHTIATSSVNGVSGLQLSSAPASRNASESFNSNALSSQNNIQNVEQKKISVIKKITNVKDKIKASNSVLGVPVSNTNIQHKVEIKKGDTVCQENSVNKQKLSKKNRKQVLKPNDTDDSFVTEAQVSCPPNMNKRRGRKPKTPSGEEGGGGSRSLNHKAHRQKLKASHDTENYTPKTARRPAAKGIRGHWRKKKRGPGRPRKVDVDDSPDLSEIDSLFEEVDKEDVENEPLVVVKAAEEENIPTVELDLFTLPSLNEQVSVLLTEPKNPNFKVYASMDAIFVGDSALGDVTNQIGYVTDANNVVFVNPGHFLFPNVEDLENFVPSPILTMKGSKINHAPNRQVWKLGSNRYPKTQKDSNPVGIKSPRRAPICDPSVDKFNAENTESHTLPNLKENYPIESQSLGVVSSSGQLLKSREKIVKDTKIPEFKKTDDFKPCPESIVKSILQASPVSTCESSSSNSNSVKRARRKSKSISEKDKQEEHSVLTETTHGISSPASENEDMKLSKDVKLSDNGRSSKKREDAGGSGGRPVVPVSEVTMKLDTVVGPKGADNFPVKTETVAEAMESTAEAPKSLLVLENIRDQTVNEILGIVSPRKGSPRKSSDNKFSVMSTLKSKKTLIVTRTIITENLSAPSSIKPKVDNSSDRVKINEEERKLVEAVTDANTETNKKMVRASVGLPRRQRRRRLRSKSAMIVSRSGMEDLNTKETVSGSEVTQGRLRHVSESSALLSKEHLPRTSVKELGIIQGQTVKNRHSSKTERYPLRGVENSSSLEQVSYPLTPKSTEPLSPSKRSPKPNTVCEKEQSEVELSQTDMDVDNKILQKPEINRKLKRRRVSEYLDIVPLKTEETSDVSSSNNVDEKCVVRAVRERRPSYKLLESLSTLVNTVGCNSKKNGLSKSDKQVSNSSEQEEMSASPVVSSAIDEQQITTLGNAPEFSTESTSLAKEKRKGLKDRYSPGPSSVTETCTSLSREWHGRGAKLKAQVLIQDQQAGVIDSQVSTCDTITQHSQDESPTSKQASCRSVTQPSPSTKTQDRMSNPVLDKSDVMSSPKSAKVCKSPRSPTTSPQNREWQARGAKLKAQVKISDSNSSIVDCDENTLSPQLTSPPSKKMKLDATPTSMRDIRTFFSVTRSPGASIEREQYMVSPSHSPNVGTTKARTPKMKKCLHEGKDIRSFFSPPGVGSATKRKPTASPDNSVSVTPTKSPKNVFRGKKSKKRIKVEPLALSACDFEGFQRCSRQSGLRAKTLLRLVSLLNTKRWYNLSCLPFPIDQLCDWDDELLDSIIFA